MPSLVESLGAQLRRIGAELPLTELNHAAARLRAATALCGYVMHESGHADWLTDLNAAGDHLDQAIAATGAVLDGLDGYLTGIGLTGIDHSAPTPTARTAPVTGAASTDRADPAMALRTWWIERVDLLTGQQPDAERTGTVRGADTADRVAPEDPVDALRRLSGAAAGGSADSYRQQLLATHPASGMQVAAPAARAMRYLATDLLGHPPGPDDLAVLTDRAGARRVRTLLPAGADELGADLVAELVGGTRTGAARHPVDAAAAWPVLVSGLLRAAGGDDADLARLATATPPPTDDTVRRDGR